MRTLEQELKNAGVRKWYSANREQFNERRRQRYASDPYLRLKARDQAKAYRQNGPEGDMIHRHIVRVVKGEAVKYFSSGTAAQLLNRSAQTIRLWETKGWIPPPADPMYKHRYYSSKQIVLMNKLLEAISNGVKTPEAKSKLDDTVKLIHEQWE